MDRRWYKRTKIFYVSVARLQTTYWSVFTLFKDPSFYSSLFVKPGFLVNVNRTDNLSLNFSLWAKTKCSVEVFTCQPFLNLDFSFWAREKCQPVLSWRKKIRQVLVFDQRNSDSLYQTCSSISMLETFKSQPGLKIRKFFHNSVVDLHRSKTLTSHLYIYSWLHFKDVKYHL